MVVVNPGQPQISEETITNVGQPNESTTGEVITQTALPKFIEYACQTPTNSD
ncbi:hypothetical protein [Suicoccus acidiformans]|uniref:hypothetical protein n=1 Tax=Suicoccus acidiformans TaxID=2036206 RepID=UPI0013C31D30|nr:hypothetical protein [Suicoccus acidiformans]